MSASAVSFRHFILGLLAQRPMSGYDIKRVLESLGWLVGNPSFGSLYPALHALREEGLVTVAVGARKDGPSRKIYNITDTGEQILEEWISRPAGSRASVKSFVMRLILADNFTPAGLITQLYQRRAQIAAQRATLEEREEALDEGSSLGRRLALNYGLALASAELAWLDSKLSELSLSPSHSTTAIRGERTRQLTQE